VLSEHVRQRPDEHVLAWLASVSDAVATAVTVGELLETRRAAGTPLGWRAA
jgi:predicted nucleic acid-binding protein